MEEKRDERERVGREVQQRCVHVDFCMNSSSEVKRGVFHGMELGACEILNAPLKREGTHLI